MTREPCFQCGHDIPHICYHDIPDASWGLHDGAIAALEAADRYLHPPKKQHQRARKKSP